MGIIRKIAEKKRRNLIEAFYAPTAANLQIAPALLQPGAETSALVELTRAYLGAVQADFPLIAAARPEEALIEHREVTLSAEDAAAMRAELAGVIRRYEARSENAAGARSHRITLLVYPSHAVEE